ncbi:hypothetical protein EDC01DRAFT_193079 [Geopyxis carbonaria]|nr:hypothetical protein EDC01DRAFT_193079 [Geopyxis carbonaria]
MATTSIRASVLVFPDPLQYTPDKLSQLSEPKLDDAHPTFEIEAFDPNIINLHRGGLARGAKIDGLLHFPTLSRTSTCTNITVPFNATDLVDGLDHANYDTIGFGPWSSPKCNRELLNMAASDRAPSIKGFLFYSRDMIQSIPSKKDPDWSGTSFSHYPFPIYAVRGLEGTKLMDHYADFSRNDVSLTDSHNNTGSGRLYVKISNGKAAALPGLWLFLLIVLGVLLVLLSLTSIAMHIIQIRRRMALRRRVAAGEVDLEALGIKRLLVPRKYLEKIPLRTYVAVPSTPALCPPSPPLPPSPSLHRPDALPPNSKEYDQPSCSICLDDFTSHVTTVRELSCHHIFHPACIDSFLEAQSSLCPLCKKSVLPKGYVPPSLTNATVRRERTLRRRLEVQQRRAEGTSGGGVRGLWARLTGRRRLAPAAAGGQSTVEMREMQHRSRPPGATATMVVQVEEEERRLGRWRRGVRAVFPGFR